MNQFEGQVVIDVSTLVETGTDDMQNKAHENFSYGVMNEIMLILANKGYITESISMDLKDNGVVNENLVEHHQSVINKANKDIGWVYNKSNIHTTRLD
ncbi:hypothetical protein SAMN05216389_10799 [Oceanobacillus limi]|uniref:Uncharacterized protein n=1 Tax=Oceanobacillus limi TaxID=930131 RepID=A0A1I0CV26_9BACI|nr:hypothetical protein [Oceanobacillus limi]SET23681.1 hypothetical protein SAMN05216389_10799 [Oceanobacillus limi]